MASAAIPYYSVYIVSGGTKYNLTSVLISLGMSESRKQVAQSATISLMNIKVNGTWLSSLIRARDRVFIYASTGNGSAEVFRGFVWRRTYQSSLSERELSFVCYDNLIYLQKSDASEFFASGKTTEDVISSICSEWGINLEYSYESITHSKLALRGKLSDILMTDILDLVKDRTGKDYVILSDQDTMKIKTVGQNSSVYSFTAGNNAIRTSSEQSMDDMITKVIILGKKDKDDRYPVEAALTKNTDTSGTIQKTISRDTNTTIEEAKEEGNNILSKNAEPKWEYVVSGPDVPWIRKGDKIYVNAGDIQGKSLIVEDVDRSITSKSKKITLGLTEPAE